MSALLEHLGAYEGLFYWLGALSVFTFFASLMVIPFLAIRIPPDYFTNHHRYSDRWRGTHPALRVTVLTLKNLLGVTLILAGMVMLVLPGQGIITIVIGLIFTDFPGKYTLEKKAVLQPAVLRSLNWIRAKAHHPPLELPAHWRES